MRFALGAPAARLAAPTGLLTQRPANTPCTSPNRAASRRRRASNAERRHFGQRTLFLCALITQDRRAQPRRSTTPDRACHRRQLGQPPDRQPMRPRRPTPIGPRHRQRHLPADTARRTRTPRPATALDEQHLQPLPRNGWNGCVTTTKPKSSLDDAATMPPPSESPAGAACRPRFGDHPFPHRQRTESARPATDPAARRGSPRTPMRSRTNDGGPAVDSGRACALVARHPFPRHQQKAGIGDEVEQIIEPAVRIVARPTVQLGLHLQYPLPGPQRAQQWFTRIHQRPPGIPALPLRTRWLPSPCDRLSRPPTTTKPPPRPVPSADDAPAPSAALAARQ